MEIGVPVNGLSKDEIIVLYNILVRFERDFRSLNSKDFNKKYPNYKELEDYLVFEKKNYAQLKEIVNSSQVNHIYMTGGKNPLEFIKHLRNGFAHSQLVKDKEVEIKDYKKVKDKSTSKYVNSLSAYGRITLESFEKTIEILSNQIK